MLLMGPVRPRLSTTLFRFEKRFSEPRLPNDALEGAALEGIAERHRNGHGGPFGLELHDAMASALADCDKSVLLENPANLRA